MNRVIYQRLTPLVLLWACTASKETDTSAPTESGAAHDTAPTDQDTAPPEPAEEVCDGVDNDGDGQVDEGFDSDGDGVGDCLQCAVSNTDAVRAEEVTPQCLPRDAEKDVWDAELTWSYTHKSGASDGQCRHPRAADLNQDGILDIICSSGLSFASIYAIDGATHDSTWELSSEVKLGSPFAVIDANGSGYFDIVSLTSDDTMSLVSHQGTSGRYSKEQVGGTNIYSSCSQDAAYCNSTEPITAADLDHDGDWEVITMAAIMSAKTMSVLSWFEHEFDGEAQGSTDWYSHDILSADLSGDGVDEIIVADGVYSIDGGRLWSIPRENSLQTSFHLSNMIIEADGDAAAEVVSLRQDSFFVLDGDGTLLRHVLTTDEHSSDKKTTLSNVGDACAGDIDGDGDTEIVIPTYIRSSTNYTDEGIISAWELSGEHLWSVENKQYHGYHSNCRVFDFDGDGAVEIVFNDRLGTHILNGSDGDERLYLPAPEGGSASQSDETMIADLDGDGSVEVIVAYAYGGGKLPSVEVYRHPEGRWPIGSRIWPTGTWSGGGVSSNGAPQLASSLPWLNPGLFRGQVQVHVEGVDVKPVLHDSCVAEAEVRLSVGAENLGPEDLTSQLRFVVSDEAGAVLGEASLTRGLAAGAGSETVEFTVSPEVAAGGLVVTLSTPDAPDCNPLNNALDWSPAGR